MRVDGECVVDLWIRKAAKDEETVSIRAKAELTRARRRRSQCDLNAERTALSKTQNISRNACFVTLLASRGSETEGNSEDSLTPSELNAIITK